MRLKWEGEQNLRAKLCSKENFFFFSKVVGKQLRRPVQEGRRRRRRQSMQMRFLPALAQRRLEYAACKNARREWEGRREKRQLQSDK